METVGGEGVERRGERREEGGGRREEGGGRYRDKGKDLWGSVAFSCGNMKISRSDTELTVDIPAKKYL